MDEELRMIVGLWNDFIENLIEARDAWGVINEKTLEGIELEEAPISFQRAISMFGKARFTVALPRLIDWVRMYSNLEDMRAEVPQEEGSEEQTITKMEVTNG